MDLKWPWLAVALIVVILALLVLWSRTWRRRGRSGTDLPISHSDRLRALPRFQVLVRRRMLLMGWLTVSSLVLLSGTVLLAARPQVVESQAPEERSRDIMLCLDGSSSMDEENVEVVGEMRAIVEDLEGERIGLTIFSGAAVTIFPLTDDYEFALDQLDRAEEAFETSDFGFLAGIQLDDDRASQMGDGIASCVQRFDRPDAERGRAVVISSDNDPQGPPVYTLAEASSYAAERDVRVYGIGSPDLEIDAVKRQEFESAVTATGGTFAILGEDGSAGDVVEGIERLERKRIEQPPQPLVRETPLTGTVITGIGGALLLGGWLVQALIGRGDSARGGVAGPGQAGSGQGSSGRQGGSGRSR